MSAAFVALVEEARQARLENKPGEARDRLTAAVALSRQTGTRSDLVVALKALGQIERDSGRGDVALPLYEEAVALCRAAGDPIKLAHTVRHVGDIHREAGRFDLAEPCYLEALALYRANEQTRPLDLANAIRPLAILKGDAGEYGEAVRLFEEARDLYGAANVAEGVAGCSKHIARLATLR